MKTISLIGTWAALLAAGGVAPLQGYTKVPPPEKVELPKPMSAADSLAAIVVPEGFQVELVASEPMVRDPIDVAWGPDGRMWVVEMADYPLGMDGKGQAGGRIVVLESTKSDGRYDRSTVFAEGLRFPTSVMAWREGILVTTVPDVLYLEDTDGDGRADRRTVVFTGMGEGNQQHLTNGLQWGLDGWLYMGNGGTPGRIMSPKSGRTLDIGQRDLRIRPDEGLLESQTGRSQYGRNRDDWGNWFGGNNSNPVWHYALEDHYLRRNPQLVPPNSTVTVPEIPGAARVYPVSETLARFNSPHGFNHFTSACGVMIYRDDLLGPEFAGNVFVCEPVHNLVHRQLVRPDGVTFSSRRAPSEQESEFFASADNWARFTSVRAGPDGALYIVDMYRLVIEHPQWIPEEWMEQLGDLRAGADRGRIYRVYPRNSDARPVPRLDRADDSGLVAALQSPSGLIRDLAQQQLAWRGTAAAVPGLEQLVTGAAAPQTRVQALCSLDLMGRLRASVVESALSDSHPGVRRQAVRLSEQFATTQPGLLRRLVALVDDSDPGVRQQLAYSLGEWKEPAAGAALAQLVRREQDAFIVAAAMSSAPSHAETMIAHLDVSGGVDKSLIEIVTATQSPRAIATLLRAMSASRTPAHPTEQLVALGWFIESLARNGSSLEQLRAADDPAVQSALREAAPVFAAARRIAASAEASLERRRAAVALLGRGAGESAADLETLTRLLEPRSPVDLQLAVVEALAVSAQASVPDALLAGWSSYAPDMRKSVLRTLLARSGWIHALLDRLEQDPDMVGHIDAAHRAQLSGHRNEEIAERARRILSSSVDSDRRKVIERYTEGTRGLLGEPQRGREVFGTLCAPCHRFGQIPGGAIGPDIANINDRSAAYLIDHILAPNQAVEGRYILYTAVTNDGRSLSGMVTGEAGNSITLLGIDGVEQVILRSELESLSGTGRSLMPDGLEAAIDFQAMADLITFIAQSGGVAAP